MPSFTLTSHANFVAGLAERSYSTTKPSREQQRNSLFTFASPSPPPRPTAAAATTMIRRGRPVLRFVENLEEEDSAPCECQCAGPAGKVRRERSRGRSTRRQPITRRTIHDSDSGSDEDEDDDLFQRRSLPSLSPSSDTSISPPTSDSSDEFANDRESSDFDFFSIPPHSSTSKASILPSLPLLGYSALPRKAASSPSRSQRRRSRSTSRTRAARSLVARPHIRTVCRTPTLLGQPLQRAQATVQLVTSENWKELPRPRGKTQLIPAQHCGSSPRRALDLRPRTIGNSHSFLMLSLEFTMVRNGKITAPLRQRGTTTRRGYAVGVKSSLRSEVPL